MTFRARLQLAFVVLAVVSVGGLAVAVRFEMTRRLTAEYQRRVTSLVAVIRDDLAEESDAIARRLEALTGALAADNRFRLSLTGEATPAAYVLDYAGDAMRRAGLSMLQIQNETGRIASSGHFRNEFDRLEPELPRVVARAPGGVALVEARTPEGPFFALVRADSVRLGDRWMHLVGGRAVGPEFLRRLGRETELAVTIRLPDTTLSWVGDSAAGTGPAAAGPIDLVAAELPLAFVQGDTGSARLADARVVVTHSLAPLIQLRQGVERWSLAAGLFAVVLAILLATWVASRLSRPLAHLAWKTSALDLARLDVDFATERTDEIGLLARVLSSLTTRLRREVQRLREAERRAAMGDLARQVNHDVKNGLVPIRNVLRHLGEVADQTPETLPQVFRERKATLDSGVAYLETLAAHYARLSPREGGQPSDVRAAVEDVLQGAQGGAVALRAAVPPGLPLVRADALGLRRILENLIGNAVDASAANGSEKAGAVVVSAERADRGGGALRITVRDTGRGMTAAQLERAFEDFYTTKPGGTGLGLSIVRRLVADLEGSLKVETEPGVGTTVTVMLPTTSTPSTAS